MFIGEVGSSLSSVLSSLPVSHTALRQLDHMFVCLMRGGGTERGYCFPVGSASMSENNPQRRGKMPREHEGQHLSCDVMFRKKAIFYS